MGKTTEVVVLGMHRSGTSALSMLLNELGVFFGLGADLINANEENPKGFWERKDVRRLNDHMLHALECEWDEVSLLDLKKLSNSELNYFDTTARAILDELGSHQALVGVKEPRICLLLPLWQRVLSNPVYVFAWRAPSEIALSLRNRSNIPLEVGEALTTRYLSSALSSLDSTGSGNALAIGVDYQKLLENPIEVAQQLSDFLALSSPENVLQLDSDRIQSVVSAELHRSKIDAERQTLSDEQAQLRIAVLEETTRASLNGLNENRHTLKDYELRKRYSLYTEVSELRKQRSVDQAELKRLMADRAMFKEEIDKLYEAQESFKKAVAQMRTASAQEKLDFQHSNANKDVEIFELKEYITDYQSLNQLLYKFFQTKIWHLCSVIVSLGAKTGLAPNAAKTLHELIALRAHIAVNADHVVEHSDTNCTVERSELDDKEQDAPSYSLIVLNRDGEEHLRALFQSLEEFEDTEKFELIIVDHYSTDGSLDIIRSYFPKIRIKLLAYRGNNSFAYGCNQGALHAASDTLVFLNNDIILDQAVLDGMQQVLRDSSASAVGVPLYYPTDAKQRSANIQHAGIEFAEDKLQHFQRPFNVKTLSNDAQWQQFPAVTAALLMCKKSDFEAIGGFYERYQYGYEDVDLCLSLGKHTRQLPVLANQLGAIHDESASQNKDPVFSVTLRRRGNVAVFKTRFGDEMDRYGVYSNLAQFNGLGPAKPFKVGLVVTEDTENTSAGDFFTASEFAQALTSELGWECVYRSQRSKKHDWYDVSELDCVIVLVDRYDLRKMRNAKASLLTVAWVRNWFERWPKHEWFRDFSVVLSSSQHGAEHLRQASNRPCHLLRIATNQHRFTPEAQYSAQQSSDYCFTGSYWNVKREIENFHPGELEYEFALYGHGWNKHKQFNPYYRGFLNYQELPSVYAGTKLLVDDANHVTRPWASVNSRVFDGIAAGAMVITNGDAGAKEVFGDLLPSYDSVDELEKLIASLLSDDTLRSEQANALRKEVLEKHTYSHRAHEFDAILKKHVQQLRKISIKIGVPSHALAPEWGDFHFAKALQKEFLRLGHRCRIDILPEWYGKHTTDDDVVLVLRGLSEYQPNKDQLNLLWMISHPDKTTGKELDQFDHVFVASLSYAETLQSQTSTPCSALMQCTDHELFYPSDTDQTDGPLLFVGNSRLQYRKIVKDSIESDLEIEVYGSRWDTIIPRKYIKGTHIANDLLREHYGNAKVLLNDHWDTMREYGFVSNRLFDAAAAGATVVSDDIEGIQSLFLDTLYSYDGTGQNLREVIALAAAEKLDRKEARMALAEHVRQNHSFRARAAEIHELVCSRNLVSLLTARIESKQATDVLSST